MYKFIRPLPRKSFSLRHWLAAFCVALILTGHAVNAKPRFMDGDIIFHTSRSSQSIAIQQATDSRYSHMGIIFHRDGKPFVYEAIATVQFTPLESWIARGNQKHYVVKRLKNADRVLTPSVLSRLRTNAANFKGLKYDLTFEWSDQRIYCSELVWKIYQRGANIEVGKLQQIKEFKLSSPEVQKKIRERYGKKIPLNETIISPSAMFESPLLETIETR